jgi:hypothetical protein
VLSLFPFTFLSGHSFRRNSLFIIEAGDNSIMKKFRFSYAFIPALFLVLSFLNLSCANADSPVQANMYLTQAGAWSLEFLRFPGNSLVSPAGIWGSSATDLYVICNDLQHHYIMHFDGKVWKDVAPALSYVGSFNAIYGFSPNDVYVVGSRSDGLNGNQRSLILHYNGISWTAVNSLDGSGLNAIHGRNSRDIWTSGDEGTIFHFDGATWNKISFGFPIDVSIGPIFETPDGITYMLSSGIGTTVEHMLSHSFAKIDGARLINLGGYDEDNLFVPRPKDRFGTRKLWGGNNSVLYSIGTNLWDYQDSTWNVINAAPYDLYNDLSGSSMTDIYAVGERGTICHYDGASWQNVGPFQGQSINFQGVISFGNNVFITGCDQQPGLVYVVRGNLRTGGIPRDNN